MKIFKNVLGVLALVFWFSSFFLWEYYSSHGSRYFKPEVGRVYPLNTHGAISYLTSNEHYILYGTMAAGALFAVLSSIIYFVTPSK
ncbi:hypothetical protein [Xanthomonas albilineans]|uniref:hypothetical protein n=1 Tax=Xanthomonas albilineans TaxID=29447 RepID=UPI0011AFF797|nr:hypothetical protein [Xanthomonas albilineans]